MSDDVYDDDNETSEEGHDIRELRRKAKDADRLPSLERENAFLKAGVNVEDPKFKYFVKAYDGDLTTAAIKAELAEAGLASTSPPPPQNEPEPEDLTGHARMAANAAGGSGAGTQSWQDALAEADRIPDPVEREAAILSVVEKHGGVTSRTAQ